MPTIDIKDWNNKKVGSVDLPEAIFAYPYKEHLIHEAVRNYLASLRQGTHKVKNRSEVSGSGKKPYRQKGTGRARQGSTRSPHWAGGGVAMGPKPRDYSQKTPKKMIQLALRSALSDRAADAKVVVIDAWDFSAPKTRDAKDALEALGLSGKVLIVLDRDDEAAYKSFRNMPDAQPILASELNAYDILCNDWVVFTRATLPGGAQAAAPAPQAEPEAPVAASEPAPLEEQAGEEA